MNQISTLMLPSTPIFVTKATNCDDLVREIGILIFEVEEAELTGLGQRAMHVPRLTVDQGQD